MRMTSDSQLALIERAFVNAMVFSAAFEHCSMSFEEFGREEEQHRTSENARHDLDLRASHELVGSCVPLLGGCISADRHADLVQSSACRGPMIPPLGAASACWCRATFWPMGGTSRQTTRGRHDVPFSETRESFLADASAQHLHGLRAPHWPMSRQDKGVGGETKEPSWSTALEAG